MPMLLEGFDLDAVLAPVPGDNAAGTDPREDVSAASIYYQLRDARAAAREAERQSEGRGLEEAPPLEWRTVRALAEQGLTGAKDLELATWLTEALVRSAGLRGLATGAAVIAGLVTAFWDGLFPTPDEDGVATRVAPLAGLSGQGVDGSLMQPIRRTVLFRRPDGAPFTYWQLERSQDLAGILDPDRRQQRLDAGVVAYDEVEKEARQAGAAHWSALRAEAAGALAAWLEMVRVLDERAGEASPSTSRVRDLLIALEQACARFAPKDADSATQDAELPGSGAAGQGQGQGQGHGLAAGHGGAAASGGLASRDQALERLAEIAAWFQRHEPNSPLSYTLDEAIRRARMSWPELIAELMPDETTRHMLISRLGIKPVVDGS